MTNYTPVPLVHARSGVTVVAWTNAEEHRLRSAGYHDPTFDPSAHSVDEVLTYLTANPVDAGRVLAAEKAGQGRVTILNKAEAPTDQPALAALAAAVEADNTEEPTPAADDAPAQAGLSAGAESTPAPAPDAEPDKDKPAPRRGTGHPH